MVNRCGKTAKVVVVDLDGTLLRSSSFKAYVQCGLRMLLNEHKYRSAIDLLGSLLIRKAGFISHNRLREISASHIGFKENVLAAMRQYLKNDYSDAVSSFIRDKCIDGYKVLLATAALKDYVPILWDGEFVAYNLADGKVAVDCRGEKKKDMVIEMLEGRCPEIFISDHISDLPLMRYVATNGGKCILANPTKQTLRFLGKLEPSELFEVELLLDSCEAR